MQNKQPSKIVLATRNPDKVREIRQILKGFELLSLNDFPDAPEVEETGETLEENAVIKARSASEASGLIALADDSGLEVDALGGLPGVRSARFAGEDVGYEDNNRKLLELLRLEKNRAARFRCVIAVFEPGRGAVTREGVCEGNITETPAGSGGFGYDPVFLAKDAGKTFAELSAAEKNAVSHRARALQAIKEYLDQHFLIATIKGKVVE